MSIPTLRKKEDFEAAILVQNSGVSPAYKINIERLFIVFEYSEDGEVVLPRMVALPKLEIPEIGGKLSQSKRVRLSERPDSWISWLLSNDAEIGFIGWISNSDEFTEKPRPAKEFALVGRVENIDADKNGFIVNDLEPCHPDRWNDYR